MKIKHTAEMSLGSDTTGIHASIFTEFLSHIPEDATISTTVYRQEADRPGESAHTEVTLRAEWGNEMTGIST